MKNYPGFRSLVRAGGGLLLLGAALTAWGINITLNDGTNSVTCATSGNATIGANGDINATVSAGATCDLSGGGDPPPPGSFTLSVAKAGTGSGTVTSSPTGINCGADCSEAYTDGTSVSLTATPASGSTFGGWSGACTGTGACDLNMTANLTVTATFTADSAPPPDGCAAPGANVIEINSGNLNQSFPKGSQPFRPAPSQVYAFKVTVPPGFSGRSNFVATRDSQALKTKAVVVSNCPGDLTPVNGQNSCSKQGATDEALIPISANSNDSSFFCKLPPGEYYINAVSKNFVSDSQFNCSSTTNCGFFGSRSSPY